MMLRNVLRLTKVVKASPPMTRSFAAAPKRLSASQVKKQLENIKERQNVRMKPLFPIFFSFKPLGSLPYNE
jgi:hypothetical protein